MTNGCGAGSCDFAAADVATLSIIPAAGMGFFVALFLLKRRNGANENGGEKVGHGSGGMTLPQGHWSGWIADWLRQRAPVQAAPPRDRTPVQNFLAET